VAVAGGHAFVTIAASGWNTCGLLADGSAYCWGANGSGELGSRVPVPLATSVRFSALWRGWAAHLCAIGTDAKAYCWGYNEWGQLGTGNTASDSVPVAVAGGLSFANISVALFHSCGVTVEGLAYCWGDNAGGQLGTGSFVSSLVPIKVAGQP
jgi:hypothetical protein